MRYSEAGLRCCVVLAVVLQFSEALSSGSGGSDGAMCRDINGSSIETGQLYIPGPKPCTICVCNNGNPTLCKAVLCKYKDQESLPNKDCKTFRFGSNCCELICLDDTLSPTTNDHPDFNHELKPHLLGFIIISLFLCVSTILFLRMKYKKREQQLNQLADDQRSLGSMGYLDRSSLQHGMPMDDLPCNGGYPLWKPPSNYFPRGEAPPPYEEAVAAARAEQALLSMNQNMLSPLNLSNAYSIEHSAHANVSLLGNSQAGGLPSSSPTLTQNNASSTSPLIPASTAVNTSSINNNNRSLSSPATHGRYQSNATEPSAPDFCSGSCTTSFAVGTTHIYENLPNPANRSALSNSVSNVNSQKTSLASPQNSAGQNYRQHKTLPRPGGGGGEGAFTISSTLATPRAHRTIPRTLAASGSLRLRREGSSTSVRRSVAHLFDTPPSLVAGDPSSRAAGSKFSGGEVAVRTNAFYDSNESRSREQPVTTPSKIADVKSKDASGSCKPPLAAANQVNEEGSFDSVTCTCSGQALPARPPPLHDDTDDYRSECENCKSASGSRYVDEMLTSPHETMTLPRRPEDAAASNSTYYRTSLTLPTNTRSRSSSSQGKWFSSMPESSTESSEGE